VRYKRETSEHCAVGPNSKVGKPESQREARGDTYAKRRSNNRSKLADFAADGRIAEQAPSKKSTTAARAQAEHVCECLPEVANEPAGEQTEASRSNLSLCQSPSTEPAVAVTGLGNFVSAAYEVTQSSDDESVV
jgi:hypothetical protein